MLTISVKKFADALTGTSTFELPELNAGAQYIYDKLFNCHITGKEPLLSEIDFEAFNLDDLDDFLTFNSSMYRHIYEINQVAQSFNKLKPAVTTGTFV
jgi:hypothetical protein